MPVLNYALIAANVLLYLFFDPRFTGRALAAFKEEYLFFRSHEPAVHQFFTYQFDMSGGSALSMRPDPTTFIPTRIIGGTSLIR